MSDAGRPPRWLRIAARLVAPRHRDDVVGDLMEERHALRRAGRSRPWTMAWALGHVLRSAIASRTIRSPLVPAPAAPGRHGRWRLDLGYATRRLLRRPAASLLAVATLTVGIGVSAGVFGIVNGLLFKTPPIPDMDRVVTIHPANRPADYFNDAEYTEFEQLRDAARGMLSVAAVGVWGGALSGAGETRYLGGELVSADYFRTLALAPAAGTFRLFDERGAPLRAAVLSYALWQSSCQADPAIVGRTIKVSGEPLTVVGVAPPGFGGILMPTIRRADLWMPFDVSPKIDPWRHAPSAPRVRLVARLPAGASRDAVRADIAAAGGRIPVDPLRRARAASTGESISDPFTGAAILAISPLWASLIPPDLLDVGLTAGSAFTALSMLVLLIACSNLANVLLADAVGRDREFAIRLAAGATRGHLVRLILIETMCVSGVALAGGLALATVIARALAATALPVTYQKLDPSPDWRVIGYGAIAAAIAAVAVAAGPAFRVTRRAPLSLLPSGPGDAPPRRLRSLLVAAQMAACTVLLVAAGLYARSAVESLRHSPGFDASHLAMARVDLGASGLDDRAGRDFLARAADAAARIPGVRRVVLADAFPLDSALQKASLVGDGGSRGHRPQISGQFARVSRGLLESLRIPLVAGRTFDGGDLDGAPRVAIVNEKTAAALWHGDEAVGHHLALLGEATGWREVVGVVRDTDVGVAGQSAPMAFVPIDQEPATRVSLAVETDRRPDDLVAPLRRTLRDVNPDVVITASETVTAGQGAATLPIRLAAKVLVALGALALAIAALGLYGVLAYTVRQRTREIGIRMALGASSRSVQHLVLRQSAAMLLGGVLPGLAFSFIGVGWLRAWLFGIGPYDPVAFITVPGLLAGVGVLAALRPARRAARVDPSIALRDL